VLAVREGPAANDEALYAEYTKARGWFTGLGAVAVPSAVLTDAGTKAGRKDPAPWPPQRGVLDEIQLWLGPQWPHP